MEEVITTEKVNNQLVSKTTYRPGTQAVRALRALRFSLTFSSVGAAEPKRAADADLVDIEALLDEGPGVSAGRQPREQAAQHPRATQATARPSTRTTQAQPARSQQQAAPVPLTGDDTTMARLTALKQLFDQGLCTKEEYDSRRKAVLQDLMSGKTANGPAAKGANPSRVTGREFSAGAPEPQREEDDDDELLYIQDYHRDVYKDGREGEALDKNPTMTMNPSGVDGIAFVNKAPVVVETLEETLPDRREGPEHAFRIIKTTMRKELLDTGVVRVTRTEKAYDGYTNAYLTMNVEQKMKPKLYFHSTDDWDQDDDFKMQAGSSKVAGDDVKHWHKGMTAEEDKEYNRVMQQGLVNTTYTTRNVDNAAGKNDFGWDGVHRFPGGKPEKAPVKQKRSVFGKKKAPAKDPNDPWAKFQDDWGDDDDPNNPRGRNYDASKPEYSDAGKKGIFNVKKAGPKRDKMMGETRVGPEKYNPGEGDREYMWDDGRGAGGFASGEQWGSGAKQHSGKHAAGGSHFHGDMWK